MCSTPPPAPNSQQVAAAAHHDDRDDDDDGDKDGDDVNHDDDGQRLLKLFLKIQLNFSREVAQCTVFSQYEVHQVESVHSWRKVPSCEEKS